MITFKPRSGTVYSQENIIIYYPKMFEDLRRVVRTCGPCQKMYAFPTGRDWFMNLPEGPGIELQIDHCGPLKDKEHDKFWILTCVDRFSGKLFGTTVETTSMDEVLIYLHEVVFSTLIPIRIHADRAFTKSEEFQHFCTQFKIELRGGAGSESQGQAEVMNREIQKKLLRLGCDSEDMSREGFQVKLSRLVHHHNSTGLQHLHWLSPNEVLLGWKTEGFKSGYMLDLNKMKEYLKWRQQLWTHLYESRKKTEIPEEGYHPGDLVLIKGEDKYKRAKNSTRNWGPFSILKNYGNSLLKLQYSDGQTGDISSKKVFRFNSKFESPQVEGDDQNGVELEEESIHLIKIKNTDAEINQEDCSRGHVVPSGELHPCHVLVGADVPNAAWNARTQWGTPRVAEEFGLHCLVESPGAATCNNLNWYVAYGQPPSHALAGREQRMNRKLQDGHRKAT